MTQKELTLIEELIKAYIDLGQTIYFNAQRDIAIEIEDIRKRLLKLN